jgi:nucleoside-diphosphate-sugar epimerase
MAKVLVTGVNGFVGSVTAEALLAAGWNVWGTARRVWGNESIPVSIVSNLGDMTINDWNKLIKDVDVIIHLAARAHVLKESAKDPLAEFRLANTIGSKILMQAAIECGVKRFVFVSSIGVNGGYSDDIGFHEDSLVSPHKDYGVSKYEAELELQKLAAAKTIELVIIRPTLVYGVGVKGNFSRLLKLVSHGYLLPFGSVKNRRTFLAIENLASFLVCCATHPLAADETFLIGDDEAFSTAELVTLLGQGMGIKTNLFPVPDSLVSFGAKLFGKQDLHNQLFRSLVVQNCKAKELLGWMPLIDARSALLQLGCWHADHLKAMQ